MNLPGKCILFEFFRLIHKTSVNASLIAAMQPAEAAITYSFILIWSLLADSSATYTVSQKMTLKCKVYDHVMSCPN